MKGGKEFRMLDVICLGELLIDFVSLQKGVSLLGSYGFKKAAGGAPSNVAVGLSRLGHKAGVISKVGADPFGEFLIKTLKDEGVDVSQISHEEGVRTALAFVSLQQNGERDFMFYRHPSADMRLSISDIHGDSIKGSKIFHYGSMSLISKSSRRATLTAAQIARESGSLVSYDPNLRISLWESEKAARERLWEGLELAQVVKMNREELFFLTGIENLGQSCDQLLSRGAQVVVVTLDEKGCYYQSRRTSDSVEAFRVEAVDTTGAGDGFMAGLLSGILNRFREPIDLSKLSRDDWRVVLRLANGVGALTTLKRGAIPGLPKLQQVERFIAKKSDPRKS
jgi:fructokinase